VRECRLIPDDQIEIYLGAELAERRAKLEIKFKFKGSGNLSRTKGLTLLGSINRFITRRLIPRGCEIPERL